MLAGRQNLPRPKKSRPKPIRDPHGTLVGYQCPECAFEIRATGPHWYQGVLTEISTHVAMMHRTLPPPSYKVRAWR